jgi:hypothetical protein
VGTTAKFSERKPGMIAVPAFRRRIMRACLLATGALVFLWLRIEEASALLAMLGGWGVTLAVVIWYGWKALSERSLTVRQWMPIAALTGAVTGLAAAIVSVLLMLLKNGLHAHLFPDFPFEMMRAVLGFIPWWMMGACLVAVGMGALWAALVPRR